MAYLVLAYPEVRDEDFKHFYFFTLILLCLSCTKIDKDFSMNNPVTGGEK